MLRRDAWPACAIAVRRALPRSGTRLCGWSSSYKRVLQEEADGQQQALGRHLDHLAGAE